jgi:hypothetical protein
MSACSSSSRSASVSGRLSAPALGAGLSAGFSPLASVRRHVEEVISSQPDLGVIVGGGVLSVAEVCARLQTMARRGSESDPLWSALVDRARSDGGVWVTIALGAALPTLVWKCSRPAVGGVERAEVEAAAVAAFVEELLAGQLPTSGVLAHLSRAANRAAQRQVDGALRCRTHTCAAEHAARSVCAGPGQAAAGHPDFALAQLVRERVLTRSEAELIGRHRLESVPLKQIAAERGWYPMQASRALRRAEQRAATALEERISRFE